MNALHRLWPEGWRPDQRTLGLLIFGFFGASAITVIAYTGSYLSLIFDYQGSNFGGINIDAWERLSSIAALVGGVAAVGAALGGLALMANLPSARIVTASALGVAAATFIVTLAVAPLGYGIPSSLANAILDIVLVVLVMRWQPLRASGARPAPTGDTGVDGGEPARQGG